MELKASGVRKEFQRAGGRRFAAVETLDFMLAPNMLTEITGRSGSGKSTLLSMLAGLLPPTEGKVTLDGTDLYALSDGELSKLRNRRIALIPQEHAALSSLTVLENVLLPSVLYRQAPDEDRALELLEKLSIRSLWDEMPSALSGGELRRMAIARALYQETPVLLADEPTGDLDEENTRIVLSVLRGAADAGKAVLLVTHEALAQDYADKVYRMEGGKLRLDDCISSRDTVK
ncbi:MAG: ABC transporter ATP-binding protein [Clostridia bacterium]|nr:ABC transporter ATP-binding protein [Clostridia bacterium]